MSNWIKTAKGLHQQFTFKSKLEKEKFLEKLQQISDKDNHHADMNNLNETTFEAYLITHDTGKIGVKDENLAVKMDALFNEINSSV